MTPAKILLTTAIILSTTPKQTQNMPITLNQNATHPTHLNTTNITQQKPFHIVPITLPQTRNKNNNNNNNNNNNKHMPSIQPNNHNNHNQNTRKSAKQDTMPAYALSKMAAIRAFAAAAAETSNKANANANAKTRKKLARNAADNNNNHLRNQISRDEMEPSRPADADEVLGVGLVMYNASGTTLKQLLRTLYFVTATYNFTYGAGDMPLPI